MTTYNHPSPTHPHQAHQAQPPTRAWRHWFVLAFSLTYLVPAQAVTVVASLPALAMVADQLLAGVGKSVVLVDGKQSPHGMALSPSQRQALAQADLVLWVGAEMESWLVKPLQSMPRNTLAITDLPQLAFLPATAAQQQHRDDAHRHQSAWDMHLWLDPSVMQRYARVLQDELVMRDPQHATIYVQNGERLDADIEQSILSARRILADMRGVPLLTTHDAWRYFFRFFNLQQGAVLQRTPDEAVQMQSLTALERQLTAGNLSCILREPQVDPKVMRWLKQRAPALVEAFTDPLGQANYAGGYPAWLLDQANEIARCRVKSSSQNNATIDDSRRR